MLVGFNMLNKIKCYSRLPRPSNTPNSSEGYAKEMEICMQQIGATLKLSSVHIFKDFLKSKKSFFAFYQYLSTRQ